MTATPTPTLAIETRDLAFSRKSAFQVTSLNLNVPTGAVYGFLGPNGSGKSTTIKLLLGQLKAKSGEIRIFDEPMPKKSASILARVGYVPERPHVYPSLTVGESIALHRSFYPTWDQPWAEELTQQFDLDIDRKLASLSKGEHGKVLMLLAIAQKPDLLILDEPTDGLDPVVRRDILAALVDYVTERDATVFVSSHLVHELERICDWIGLMDGGRLITELPMQEFKSGIKRLRVVAPPLEVERAPFTVLARERSNGSGVEQWVVRGWKPGMHEYVESVGASVREVIDLDLEDGFVELLRSHRNKPI
jgi:ABC-2 type transport system ATP-binding protein